MQHGRELEEFDARLGDIRASVVRFNRVGMFYLKYVGQSQLGLMHELKEHKSSYSLKLFELPKHLMLKPIFEIRRMGDDSLLQQLILDSPAYVEISYCSRIPVYLDTILRTFHKDSMVHLHLDTLGGAKDTRYYPN